MAKTKWTTTEQKLPETSDFYLVTLENGAVSQAWFSTVTGWDCDEKIMAWMDLPKPCEDVVSDEV